MTTVHTKCERCDKWTIEREMDYFTEIGLVCMDCRNDLLNENYQKSTNSAPHAQPEEKNQGKPYISDSPVAEIGASGLGHSQKDPIAQEMKGLWDKDWETDEINRRKKVLK